CMQGIQFPLIF
nr:immunoglobulin light chain junction region [Macaca mulatta]